jgi:hypothetical protein
MKFLIGFVVGLVYIDRNNRDNLIIAPRYSSTP